jgi:hypothetical protein
MRGGKKSIADIASGNDPTKEIPKEAVFEGDGGGVAFIHKSSYINEQIIKHSFGLIPDETKANRVIFAVVGILVCATILIIIRASSPAHKVPADVLKINMERMHSK